MSLWRRYAWIYGIFEDRNLDDRIAYSAMWFSVGPHHPYPVVLKCVRSRKRDVSTVTDL